jgi:hypothetical protein
MRAFKTRNIAHAGTQPGRYIDLEQATWTIFSYELHGMLSGGSVTDAGEFDSMMSV